MEWAEDSHFEDRATLGIINRNLPVPKYNSYVDADLLTIKTKSLVLNYKGEEVFSPDNLEVRFKLGGKTVRWTPGADDSGNLKGTTRTLDGCSGPGHISKDNTGLENGIISRDGWSVIDESERHLIEDDDSDWGGWVAEKDGKIRKDLYIFAYGHDYKAALRDFTAVAGRIPLPPRYTLGYWWSRYWAYTDTELLALAREIRDRGIPIDVFIVDMDWHETWKGLKQREESRKDAFGMWTGWTGYTWNRNLFPDPEGFLHDIHALGYRTALNLHPAGGIQVYEDCYDSFVRDYLSRTTDYDGPEGYVYGKEQYSFKGAPAPSGKEGWRAPVPFRIDQKAWADAYFASVLHPIEKMGVDFWWLDWQQYKESRYVKGLSNTFWLNWVFWNDKVRQSVYKGKDAPRPLIYHRWGGLGSHRYQLGFSGDTHESWDVLGFLPYFTATASNVGYGYWGHDIGGHYRPGEKSKEPTDPEMFTRWIQYGVFTPLFKTHSTNNPLLDRRIWAYPDHYEYMKQAIILRYALSPYIYTAAREAFDTGISICRPLYYDYPEVPQAYEWKEEFLFGDRILATALCQPIKDGKTERKMWFPAGSDWYDMAHHRMEKGGSVRTLYYAIDENPWYIKAGSILPLAAEGIRNLQEEREELRLLVVPGKGRSSYTLYEDDGISQAYGEDFATTLITKETTSRGWRITVDARKGAYKGMLSNRKLTILLEGVQEAPGNVNVSPEKCSLVSSPAFNGIQIDLPETPADQRTIIEITR
jgi:alpha-glucosidase